MSYQLINRSAHDTGLADASVHCVVTSPPYFSLRQYSGEQAIEWPTVEYSPMPGLPTIRIQGCEPGCDHEWADGRTIRQSGGKNNSTLNGGPGYQNETHFTATQGAYCIHCGGWRGGLGLESTIEAYIGHLILVMREMWRVLKPQGTAWINLGDSYAGSGGAHTHDHANPGISRSAARNGFSGYVANDGRGKHKPTGNGLRAKNMMGVPWRFAFAAQADGWILRSDIIWHKTAPMPESVADRPTKAHEYVFLLTKQEEYYYDAEAIKEPCAESGINRQKYGRKNQWGHVIEANGHMESRSFEDAKSYGAEDFSPASGKNKRSVWSLGPSPFPGAHFATFPMELPTICIRAGTSAHGVCPACGASWRRVVEYIGGDTEAHERPKKTAGMNSATSTLSLSGNGSKEWAERGGKRHTTGWEPTCECNAGEPVPATVLDPFSGSGTTGKTALMLGRNYIGVDISQEYLENLAPGRLSNIQMEMPL